MFVDHRELLKMFASVRPKLTSSNSMPKYINSVKAFPLNPLLNRTSKEKGTMSAQRAYESLLSHLPMAQKPHSRLLRGSLTVLADRKLSNLSPTPTPSCYHIQMRSKTATGRARRKDGKGMPGRAAPALRSIQHPPTIPSSGIHSDAPLLPGILRPTGPLEHVHSLLLTIPQSYQDSTALGPASSLSCALSLLQAT